MDHLATLRVSKFAIWVKWTECITILDEILEQRHAGVLINKINTFASIFSLFFVASDSFAVLVIAGLHEQLIVQSFNRHSVE